MQTVFATNKRLKSNQHISSICLIEKSAHSFFFYGFIVNVHLFFAAESIPKIQHLPHMIVLIGCHVTMSVFDNICNSYTMTKCP